MATAISNYKDKEILVKQKKRVIDTVSLELTPLEAQVLAQVLSSVGGCPKKTARNITDNIRESLSNIGFLYFEDRNELIFENKRCAVYFKNSSLEFIKEKLEEKGIYGNC